MEQHMEPHCLSGKELYDYLAHHIEREDGLVDRRLSWMLTFQGFLFTSLALFSSPDQKSHLYHIFKLVIPGVGMIVAFTTAISICSALKSLTIYKNKWFEYKESHFMNYPPPFLEEQLPLIGWINTLSMPFVTFVAWFIICLTMQDGVSYQFLLKYLHSAHLIGI